MARINEAHLLVLESLTEALLRLMEQKPLSKINVSELCDIAGVSRVSFYRNYHNLDEILVRHLTRSTDEWWRVMLKKPKEQFYRDFWPGLLEEYRKNERLILLLYQNNASYILKDHIFSCCGPALATNERDAYLRAALAGTLYGLVDEWIRRGMGSLPEGFHLVNVLEFANAQGIKL